MAKGTCSTDDCDAPVVARGMCSPCYKRWKKYGDPLKGGPKRSKLPGAAVCQADDCDLPPKGKSGISGQYCSGHRNRLGRYGSPNGRPGSKLAPDANERTCTWCGLVKPLSEFGPLSAGQLGHRSRCRPCEAERQRGDRAAASPEVRAHRNARMRRWQIRKAYGEDGLIAYERIQAGAGCDICGGRTPKMAIDHDHATGVVRGVLCKDCNLILGWAKDDPGRLRDMAAYLEKAAAQAA